MIPPTAPSSSTSVTDRANNTTNFGYDGNGNLTSVTEPLGNNTTATAQTFFNADGTVARSLDFLGNQTTYLSYDANGLPTKIADGTDSPTSPTHPLQIDYDAAGRTTFTQDENHAQFNSTSGIPATDYQSQFLYDTFGRLGRQTTPKSTSLSLGTLVETDTTYDPNDNVLSVVAPHCVPAGACTNDIITTSTTAYDVMDRKLLDTDPSNNKTGYAYDVAGRLNQVTLPLGELNATPNNTHTVSYSYDALDRTIIQTQDHVNPDSSVSALNTFACYDSVGDMVSVTQPKAGLGSLTCPGTTSTPFTTVYSYDAAHHTTGSTDADGHASSFTYDANGNVADQDQNGLEQNDSTTNRPNGVVVKDGHKLHSDYDAANWLTDQLDSTLNQRVVNSFTPIGLESNQRDRPEQRHRRLEPDAADELELLRQRSTERAHHRGAQLEALPGALLGDDDDREARGQLPGHQPEGPTLGAVLLAQVAVLALGALIDDAGASRHGQWHVLGRGRSVAAAEGLQAAGVRAPALSSARLERAATESAGAGLGHRFVVVTQRHVRPW